VIENTDGGLNNQVFIDKMARVSED